MHAHKHHFDELTYNIFKVDSYGFALTLLNLIVENFEFKDDIKIDNIQHDLKIQ